MRIAAGLLMTVAATSFAYAADIGPPQEECPALAPETELFECRAQELKLLNSLISSIRTEIRPLLSPTATSDFSRSHTSWSQYRDTHCRLESAVPPSNYTARLVEVECRLEIGRLYYISLERLLTAIGLRPAQ